MPLLRVSDLHTHYATRQGVLRAVDGVSFEVQAGETLGVVGESGCGKSTLGKSLLRLVGITAGSIAFDGVDLATLEGVPLNAMRKRLQMIFQDPAASLNPRHSIGSILEAPLKVHGMGTPAQRRRKVLEMVDSVGLPVAALDRYPHEFSGGQRQRIGIARALILGPDLLVCDEPVSALDLSVQAQILNLLAGIKGNYGLSYVFISHDLSVMHYFADRIMVMYLGRIVELADRDSLWDAPLHPYTQALMAAVPDTAKRRHVVPIQGDLPSPHDVPSGCRFHPRCSRATDICASQDPALRVVKTGHIVACHHAGLPPASPFEAPLPH